MVLYTSLTFIYINTSLHHIIYYNKITVQTDPTRTTESNPNNIICTQCFVHHKIHFSLFIWSSIMKISNNQSTPLTRNQAHFSSLRPILAYASLAIIRDKVHEVNCPTAGRVPLQNPLLHVLVADVSLHGPEGQLQVVLVDLAVTVHVIPTKCTVCIYVLVGWMDARRKK
jgi:hypothetical protein